MEVIPQPLDSGLVESGESGTVAPTVLTGCPEDFEFEYGATAKVTFSYQYSLGSSGGASFDIDYGDGKSYHSPDDAHAERNLFWHDYSSPGTFTAAVRMVTTDGLEASHSCTFTYSWSPLADTGSPGFDTPGGGLPGSGFDAASCTYDLIPLRGRVQIVDFLPDFTVQIVDFLPDLRVQTVDLLPNSCGKWQIVDFLPDFTVQIVDFLPDVQIQMVDFLPGT